MVESDIKLTVPTKKFSIYSLLATSNTLSTKAYFLLQKNADRGLIDVYITLKSSSSSRKQRTAEVREILAGFKEALLENQIRFMLTKNNISQRSQMMNHALTNPVFLDDKTEKLDIPESIAKILEEDSGEESYLDDPLNIATPWEAKD